MELAEKLMQIKAIICIADGVLTSGEYFIVPGNEFDYIRGVHKHDAIGLRLIIKSGIQAIIITGDSSQFLTYKVQSLGITDVITDSQNRQTVIATVCEKYHLKKIEILYIGDDLYDYNVMNEIGVSACPHSAVTKIKEVADFVTNAPAGKGAVREVIDLLAKAQGIELTDFI